MAIATKAPEDITVLCDECMVRPKALVMYEGRKRRLKLCAVCIERRRQGSTEMTAPRKQKDNRRHRERPDKRKKGPQRVDANGRVYCDANKKQTEGTCDRPAGWGTDHPGYGRCKNHGGSTPAHRVRAAKDQASAQALTLGAPIDIGPMDALLWCVRIAAGEVAYFTMQVNLLAQAEVAGNMVETKERPLSYGKEGESRSMRVQEITTKMPTLHIWVKARQDAIDRLARFTKMALDANVAEREVQLSESYGAMIGRIVGRILDGLRLTPDQQLRAPELVRKEMSVIESEERDVK